jgi:hypothetical protein
MANEARRMPVRGIVVGYVLLSLFVLIAGRSILHTLPLWDHALIYLGVHAALGPLAVMSYAIWGRGYSSILDWSLHGPAIVVYLTATLLLAAALALAVRRLRYVRWIGYVLAAIVWVGTGFLMAVVHANG